MWVNSAQRQRPTRSAVGRKELSGCFETAYNQLEDAISTQDPKKWPGGEKKDGGFLATTIEIQTEDFHFSFWARESRRGVEEMYQLIVSSLQDLENTHTALPTAAKEYFLRAAARAYN